MKDYLFHIIVYECAFNIQKQHRQEAEDRKAIIGSQSSMILY